jgi:hypothetical protein
MNCRRRLGSKCFKTPGNGASKIKKNIEVLKFDLAKI